ncbi:S8 family peptidase [Herpetosiphon sp.]|nr:S8 family peptidase [Herpetosiphon sp.]
MMLFPPTNQHGPLARCIVVKFHDQQAPLIYTDQNFQGYVVQPLFNSVDPDQLVGLVQQAQQTNPEYQAPNFLAFFAIDVEPDQDPFAIIEEINQWAELEYAYVESPPAPVPTDANPRRARQTYLNPPSSTGPTIGGIDAEAAWKVLEHAGKAITIVDIEKSWQLEHPDLLQHGSSPITILPSLLHCDMHDPACADHGTNVLGVLVAQNNTEGGVGIAHDAAAAVISPWQKPSNGTNQPSWNIANAIVAASNYLTTLELSGNLILLELQIYQDLAGGPYTNTPNQPGRLLPVELEPANFEAIRLASELGIIVIEAAGNGASDLATCWDTVGTYQIEPETARYRDSGAILVGAVYSRDPNKATRTASSNYGQRVNCFAWGNGVFTTNASGYSLSFGGTSAAAAIIAGAAILAQAIGEQLRQARFSPEELRRLLTHPDACTYSAQPQHDRVGVMPDLGRIIGLLQV